MKYIGSVVITLFIVSSLPGCKKSSHEIIMGPTEGPPAPVVTVKKVQSTKQSDRDGDFYQDIFYIENTSKLSFVKAQHKATIDIGLMTNLNYEDTVDGELITVRRRNKNVSYELHTDWEVPNSIALYSMKYAFTAKWE